MEEKINSLYKECIDELVSIGIPIDDEKTIGKIDIKISPRKTKRYGCCKQENPDKTSSYMVKRRVYYKKYNNHHIEISKWLMDLNDDIIKNTIIHELIHCMPDCNNHGAMFKMYSNLINNRLGYNITRLGNKVEDYKKSNLEYKENISYKYKIVCKNCGHIYYRQRIVRNFLKKYCCSLCKGKLQIV